MKPAKNVMPVAKWLLRIAIVLFVYFSFFEFLNTWNFQNIEYLIVFVIAIFSVLLFIGGFLKSNSLTVISGLLIFLLSLLVIVLKLPDIQANMILTAGMGFYFLCSGNFYYYK